MVRELRLNMLPAELDMQSSAEKVYRLERWSAGEEKVRGIGTEAPGAFHIFSYAAFTYVWSRPGRQLPDALDAVETETVSIVDLPAAVTAFAIREAIADRLVIDGFERLPGSIGRPIRLFRRLKNLAEEALGGQLRAGTGIFPAATVQGICLTDDDVQPGPVGAVLDVNLLNRLDVPLAELAQAGIPLAGIRLVWRHQDGCRCGPDRPEGKAGKLAGGDLRGLVEVARGGTTREFPAACLGPVVSRMALEQYFGRLRNLSPSCVYAKLDAVTSTFQQPAEQWRYLQFLSDKVNPATVFAATSMRLAMPITATAGDTPTPATPTVLPYQSAPTLNFRHGAARTAQGAAVGLSKHGPYDKDSTVRLDVIRALVLCPKVFEADGQRLVTTLRQPADGFPGIERRYALRSFIAELRIFDGQSDTAYRAAAVEAAQERPDLVFLIIKYEDRYAPVGRNPYLAAKALLTPTVPSQAVTVETIRQSSLRWAIDSIGLQSYAKLGNVPYVLHDPHGSVSWSSAWVVPISMTRSRGSSNSSSARLPRSAKTATSCLRQHRPSGSG